MKKLLLLLLALVSYNLQAQITIAEARGMALGETVTVEGIVLNGETLGNGRFLQDATGAISSFGNGIESTTIGDYISITGELSEYNGLLQISPIASFEILGSFPTPTPQDISVSQIGEDTESELVSVENVTFSATGTFESGTYEITDASGTSIIYLRFSNPLVGTEIPTGEVSMVGIVSQFNDHQLLPRDFEDVSWEIDVAPPAEPISIAEARSTALGTEVTIQGIVTSGETLGNGRFIQDATAGISSFGGVDGLNIGDEVSMTGTLSEYNGLLQLSPVASVEVLSTGNELPTPIIVAVSEINEANEGSLVQVEDVLFTETGTFASGNYEISNTTGTSIIYLRSNNPLVGTSIPSEAIDITGIVGQFNDHQLLPRDAEDFSSGGGTTNPPNENVIPIIEARNTALAETVTIQGIVTSGDEFGVVRYVQDTTAGIACYPGSGSQGGFPENVQPGDEVVLTGVLVDYNGLLEISPITSYEVLSSNNDLPEPQIISAGGMNDDIEGSLVTFEDVYFTDGGNTFAGGNTYEFYNEAGETEIIYLRSSNPISGNAIPLAKVNITGIVSEFNGFQLLPRTIDDIVITSSLFITENISLKGGIEQNSLTFSWATNAPANATAMYGLTPDLELGMINGSTNSSGLIHTATIEGLEPATCYYIQASSTAGNETAFSSTILGSTASNSSGNIDIYFNRSVDFSYADAENEATYYNPASIQNLMVDYINKAESTIDMAVYNNNRDAIVIALNQAVARGVQVRYVHALATANLALVNNDIDFPILGANAENLMHNKFMVIDAENTDKCVVMTGSMNLTDNNILTDANNLIFIQDQSLARVYTKEFEEMWGSSDANPGIFAAASGASKEANTPTLFNIGGTEVELYFSPTDNTTSKIINALNSAEDNVQFALLSFTRNDLGSTIANLHNGGVDVRGIIENINDTGGEFDYLANTVGVNVVDDEPTGELHHKYAIIDEGSTDPRVVTGSHNWSSGAENFNDENTLIIHSQAIANIYIQEFEQRWCEANGNTNCAEDNGGEEFVPEDVSIEEELRAELNIFPNPATNVLNIESDVLLNSYTIYDVNGRLVFGGTFNDYNNAINVSYLGSGTYFVSVSDGERFKVVSFVVE